MRISEQPPRCRGILFLFSGFLPDFFNIAGKLIQRRYHVVKQDIHEKGQEHKRGCDDQGDYYSGMQDIPAKLPLVDSAYNTVAYIGNRRDINQVIRGVIIYRFLCGKGVFSLCSCPEAGGNILGTIKGEGIFKLSARRK